MALHAQPATLIAAVGLASLLTVPAHAANVTLCFDSAVSNVALLSNFNGVETGIVITDTAGKAVVKANNYKDNGAGTYWDSKLPQSFTLPGGCSVFYFMTKTTEPKGGSPWICNGPIVNPGNPTTVIGSVGGGSGVVSGTIIIPSAPSSGKSDLAAACPDVS